MGQDKILGKMRVMNTASVIANSGVVFGTSGARGLVEQFTDEVCAAFTVAFIAVMQREFSFSRLVLGIDRRPSSPDMARACAAAAASMGVEVEFCGVLPTPALALQATNSRTPAIVITGSHIPFDRNGIKFYRPDGEITKDDEGEMVAATIEMPGAANTHALPEQNDMALSHYMQRYLNFFPENMLTGLKIGFYQHSSVARDLLTELLETLGADVVPLERTDTFVPIDTEAVSEEDRARGRRWAKEYKLDALLSTDGDADRPLIGDENGDWLRGDVVGTLCAQYLHAAAVATPVSSTTAIERCGAFKRVIRTRIGSPYVIEGMEQAVNDGHSPVVGFEANGGFLLASRLERNGSVLEPLPTRDAVLPILALLAMAQEKACPVSALSSELPQRFTASDRLQDFAHERSTALLENLSRQPGILAELFGAVRNTDTTDGQRITFESGEVIHLRRSGNAPELRCYAEADTQERASELVNEVLTIVAKRW